MPRINGLVESGLKAADALLKSGEGYVFSITIAWKGVTAGELFNLKDGLNDSAAVEVPFVFGAANGTMYREWSQGKKFDTGIFANIGPTAGVVWYEVTYS